MSNDHRPSYEDLARRDSVLEEIKRREVSRHRGHDDVYVGVILMMGLLGLILYFIARS